MKIAYFGIDALIDCLKLLMDHDYEVVKIFTMEDDPYDKTTEITNLALKNNIEIQKTKVRKEDIDDLIKRGVSLSITAGYAYKIPVTDAFLQLNIHPAYLPEGRGSWPMPVQILKGLDSGVTIHELSEDFDCGDILIKQKIEVMKTDDLISLEGKIKTLAPILLEEVLEDLDYYLQYKEVQTTGSYYPMPTDLDRTLLDSDSKEIMKLKDRAFKGYGLLKEKMGVPFEVSLDNDFNITYLKPYFRKLTLDDLEEVERIRLKYDAKLSDYVFSLLYCWQNPLNLEVCLGKDFYLVKMEDTYFFPVGDKETSKMVLDSLLQKDALNLRFGDKKQVKMLKELYKEFTATFELGDSDYLYVNEDLVNFHGPHLIKRRNDYHHFMNLEPNPYAVPINETNIKVAKELSKIAYLNGSEDYEAESIALKNFFKLGLEGVLIYKGEEAIGFAIRIQKDEETIEGHFCKCLDRTRGGALFTIIENTLDASEEMIYTNMEDDMNDLGLRIFKSSLNPIIVKSYSLRLEMKA